MGRLNSHGNVKGNNTKHDEEEKYKPFEPENAKHQDERNSKPDKHSSKQKDRIPYDKKDKRFDIRHEKYERHQGRAGIENDQDRRTNAQGKEPKEHIKSTTQEDNRKRHEGKFDYKHKPKDDRDTSRNDVPKGSVKSEGRNNSGKDRREFGRYNDRPYSSNKNATKDDQSTSNNDRHNENIECMNTRTDSPSTSIEPTKEKERSGKSYSSKRRERQQQRNEQ